MIGDTASHHEKLGQGRTGEVIFAEDTSLNRPVVIKVLSREFVHGTEQTDVFSHQVRLQQLTGVQRG